MRVPLSWLRDYVDLPADVDNDDLGERLVDSGLELEEVVSVGGDVTGPLVVGHVLEIARTQALSINPEASVHAARSARSSG